MSLALSQSYTAIAGGQTASFLAIGGTPPYVYSVLPGGPGGNINSSTGVYTAPPLPDADPRKASDVIQVVDSVNATAQAFILVGTIQQLFCDILQREMGLARGRVYLWDQTLQQPTDSGLYIAVSILREKMFGNNGRFSSAGQWEQYSSVQATFGIDVISRGPEARDQKELVIMTLFSQYAEQQMEKNCFFIGKLPAGGSFTNLSNPDGAAIPYRFHIDINVQYMVRRTSNVDYFDTFSAPSIVAEP